MSWPLLPQRRADDEDVDAEPADELRGLAVDPAIDVDLAAERLVAEQVAGRQQLRLGDVLHERPGRRSPGSTVMTSTMSSSSRYGSSADSGVPGLTASPAARPAARIRAQRRRDLLLDLDVEGDRVAAGVEVLVEEPAGLVDHQVGVERQLRPPAGGA